MVQSSKITNLRNCTMVLIDFFDTEMAPYHSKFKQKEINLDKLSNSSQAKQIELHIVKLLQVALRMNSQLHY